MSCQIELTTATRLFDGDYSWAHPRAGAIPPRAPGNPSAMPLVVMTLQTTALAGSDLFSGLHQMRTADLGTTWSQPEPIAGFEVRPIANGREWTVCDFTPRWHAASGKLLGTGHSVIYENGRVPKARPRTTEYSVYDPVTRNWSAPRSLVMPDLPKFANAGAGSTQRFDLPNGDILLPISFREMDQVSQTATVLRCRFDGETLSYLEHGSELTHEVPRGFYEPSVTQYRNRFYLTLRNDQRGHVTTSDDGLHYHEPQPWLWDDGSDLGNYNTQQHWVTHREGLFLAYTRRGAGNDHVMRHRAPLFIARVDPDTLRVLRSTERILMPNRGARLGNFAVTEVSDHETWVTDAEWMQPKGCEQYGSDGSVWVAKVHCA